MGAQSVMNIAELINLAYTITLITISMISYRRRQMSLTAPVANKYAKDSTGGFRTVQN